MIIFTNHEFMIIPSQDNYVLYPGSGTDLTPLLAEHMLLDEGPGIYRNLKLRWTASRMLLCDNSPSVHQFFNSLKRGSLLYDKERKIVHCGKGYEQHWHNSPVNSLRVQEITREQYDHFFEDDRTFQAIILRLEAKTQMGTMYARVDFFPCSFEELSRYYSTDQTLLRFTGMFLIGMSAGKHFLKDPITEEMKFIVTDFPPSVMLPHFLPVHMRLPLYGNQQRRFSARMGAAVYLSREEFAVFRLKKQQYFWIVPGLFVAGIVEGESEEAYLPKSDFSEDLAVLTPEESMYETATIRSLLDDIDALISSHSTVLFHVSEEDKELLALVVGCWLIRHGISSMEQVIGLLAVYAEEGRFAENTLPLSEQGKTLLSEWVPGM